MSGDTCDFGWSVDQGTSTVYNIDDSAQFTFVVAVVDEADTANLDKAIEGHVGRILVARSKEEGGKGGGRKKSKSVVIAIKVNEQGQELNADCGQRGGTRIVDVHGNVRGVCVCGLVGLE